MEVEFGLSWGVKQPDPSETGTVISQATVR